MPLSMSCRISWRNRCCPLDWSPSGKLLSRTSIRSIAQVNRLFRCSIFIYKIYIDLLENDLVDLVMWVDLHDLLEIWYWVVLGTCEHLGLLNLVHEWTVSVRVGDNNTWLISQSVGNDDIVDLFEKEFLDVVDKRLILFREELLFLSFQFIIIRHLEITLTHIDNVLSLQKKLPSSHTLSRYWRHTHR